MADMTGMIDMDMSGVFNPNVEAPVTKLDSEEEDNFLAMLERFERNMRQELHDSAKFRGLLMDANDRINEAGHLFVDALMPETLEIPEGHTEEEMEAVAQDVYDFANKIFREIAVFGTEHAAKHGHWCVESMEKINEAYGGESNE